MVEKPDKSRTALVTGAAGYIGSHLVKELVACGWCVHVIVRPTTSQGALKPVLDQITVHVHDGSTTEMVNILEQARPEVVFHLAAKASAEHSVDEVDAMLSSNVLFSTQLVEAMFRTGVRNFVNTETFWQFQHGSDEYSPVCLYAATKQAFHDILKYYVGSGHINALSLVLYDTYGADDTRKKLFTLLKQAAKDKRLLDMTPGEQIIDISHVDDVVAAYMRAGEILLSKSSRSLDTYAVSSGQRMSLRQLVELIDHECVCPTNVNWGGKLYRPNEVMNPWVGRQLPGWQPKVPLETGLRQVFQGGG